MSDMKVCFSLLCGLPAAGKSTFLKYMLTLVKDLHFTVDGVNASTNLTPHILVVGIQYDSLLPFPLYTEQYAENSQVVKFWKHSRHEVLLSVDALVQALCSCKGKNIFSVVKPEGVNDDLWKRFLHSLEPLAASWTSQTDKVLIIVDDNMHLRSMRYEYYRLARSNGAGYCQVFMEISPENALVRNSMRLGDCKVSDDVILRMAKAFEIPDGSKNFWEKFTLAIPYESSVQKDEIISFIRAAFVNPFQPLQPEKNEEVSSVSRSQCSSSLIHQADLILRKCVSLWLAECKLNRSSTELPQCVQHASHNREVILSMLRNEEIEVPLFEAASLQHAAQDPECLFYKFIKNLFFANMKNGL